MRPFWKLKTKFYKGDCMDREELGKRYGYAPETIRVLLSRPEFSAYTDDKGNITEWDDNAEKRMERIVRLKNKGRLKRWRRN